MFAKIKLLDILKSNLDHMFDHGGKCMNDYKLLASSVCTKELLKEKVNVKISLPNGYYQQLAKNILTRDEEFNSIYIYVDESTYIDGLNDSNCFLTGFYLLPGSIKEKTFANYCHEIYKDIEPRIEVKSFNSSDAQNQEALKLGREFFNECSNQLISPGFFLMSNKGGDKLNTVTRLENYLVPIYHHLMSEISTGRLTVQKPINIKIIIDARDDLKQETDFAVAARYLMNIWMKKFKEQGYDFNLTLTTADSKKNMGIQIADMFVGAYRKDLMYGTTSPKSQLLDFKFEKYDASVIPEEDDDFLKLFGLLQLVSIEKMKKANSKVQKPQPVSYPATMTNIPSFLETQNNNVEKAALGENESLDNIGQTDILRMLIETIELVKESSIARARKQNINNFIFMQLCLDLKNFMPSNAQINLINMIGTKAVSFKENCEKVIANLKNIPIINDGLKERLKQVFDQMIAAILVN